MSSQARFSLIFNNEAEGKAKAEYISSLHPAAIYALVKIDERWHNNQAQYQIYLAQELRGHIPTYLTILDFYQAGSVAEQTPSDMDEETQSPISD